MFFSLSPIRVTNCIAALLSGARIAAGAVHCTPPLCSCVVVLYPVCRNDSSLFVGAAL
jgi:hypothetical protein